MRWDRLFAEIEASLDDEAAIERDALAAELADEEWSSTHARDLIWGDVSLEIRGLGWIEGRVVRAAGDFVVLEAHGRDLVVARTALLGWRGGVSRAPEPDLVTARLGWAQLLRAARDDGAELRLVRVDGSQVSGVVQAVAQDAVLISPVGAGGPVWLVMSAVSTMQVC